MSENSEEGVQPVRNWRVPELFPSLDSGLVERLHNYQKELIKFNSKINLISTRSEENCDLVHIIDSLFAAQIILNATQQKEIFDIGSGNGLPGVVMATIDPERQIVILDKDSRKIEFIKHVCSRLELSNVSFVNSRAEELEEGRVHCAVSRGFASVSKSIISLRKVFATGADYFHIKSDSWAREVAEMPTQACAFWEPSLVDNYKIPIVGSDFSVVLTKKIA